MKKTKHTKSSFQQMSSERKLESVFLFVTGKCNAKCTMCFYAQDMDKKEKDLTFDEIRKLSESAGEFNRLWLSGGEPTLREDLPEIIEMFHKNNKVKDVNMPTNALKQDCVIEWIERIRKSCPDLNLTISILVDGFDNTHDTQRAVPGSFYKAVAVLKKIDEHFGNDAKVLKNVSTVITRYNIEEVTDFMTWMFGFLSQFFANLLASKAVIAIRNCLSVIIHTIVNQMDMWVFLIEVPRYNILCVHNTHLFHIIVSNPSHQLAG